MIVSGIATLANHRRGRHLEGVARGLGTDHRTRFLLLAPASRLVARHVQLFAASPATLALPTALASITTVSAFRVGAARGRRRSRCDGSFRGGGRSGRRGDRRGGRGWGGGGIGHRFRRGLFGPRALLLLGLAQLAQGLLLLPHLRFRPQGLVELLLTPLRLFLQCALRGIHACLGVAFLADGGACGVRSRSGARHVHSAPPGLDRHRLAASLRRGDSQLADRFPPQGDLARRRRFRPALAVKALQVREKLRLLLIVDPLVGSGMRSPDSPRCASSRLTGIPTTSASSRTVVSAI